MTIARYLVLLISVAFGIRAAAPKPETIAAFDRYVKITEDGFAQHQGPESFLWVDGHPKEKSLVWLGQSAVIPMQTLDQGKEIEIPDGAIQHWLGAIFVENANANVENARGLLLNFAGYKDFFRQQIIESKLNKHEGDQYDFFLRFYKKQVSTVMLNVNETAKYTLIDPVRWSVACHSTHVGEVEHPKDKKKRDQERSPEEAAGYLWRFNFYFRVQQSDNGMYIELEVITLAREEGGKLSPGRFLNGFQSFPNDLTQAILENLNNIFPHRR